MIKIERSIRIGGDRNRLMIEIVWSIESRAFADCWVSDDAESERLRGRCRSIVASRISTKH